MFKTVCLLVLAEFFIGAVLSWDIAVTTDTHIKLYSNNTEIYSEKVQFRDVSALAYDAVHDVLLFAGTQNHSSYIFCYDLVTKNLTRKKSNVKNIQGLAYDPVKKMVFWTNPNQKSIYSISIKGRLRRSKDKRYVKRIIEMDDQFPMAIAVDSCKEYIYWANIFKPSIERARFDGKKKQTIIKNRIHMPLGIAIDQISKKIYWTDKKEGIYYSIESADLHGHNRTILTKGTNQEPRGLTISTNAIYWVDTINNAIWKLPKNPPEGAKPIMYIEFGDESPFGIAASYPTVPKISSLNDCKRFKKVIVNNSTVNLQNSFNDDIGFCVHGTKVKGKLKCICPLGYTGDRCSVWVCYKYCLYGHCTVSAEGQPKCRCIDGYTGTRCNKNVCQDYCQNQGICLSDKQNKPFCKCLAEYEGSRCEILCTTRVTSRAEPLHESGVTGFDCNSRVTSYDISPHPLELLEGTKYEYNMIIILSKSRIVSSRNSPLTKRTMSLAAASKSSMILFAMVMATVLLKMLINRY